MFDPKLFLTFDIIKYNKNNYALIKKIQAIKELDES